jgi:hypothetical protein
MGSISKNIALLAIGFWLGCCVLFAAVVAPTLFNNDITQGLSREMAGAITGAILRRIYFISYICLGVSNFFLLAICFGEAKKVKGPRRALLFCIIALSLSAANQFLVTDQIQKAKVEMTNPGSNDVTVLKQKFDRWHQASTVVYSIAVGCGIIAAIFLLAPVATGKSRGGK